MSVKRELPDLDRMATVRREDSPNSVHRIAFTDMWDAFTSKDYSYVMELCGKTIGLLEDGKRFYASDESNNTATYAWLTNTITILNRMEGGVRAAPPDPLTGGEPFTRQAIADFMERILTFMHLAGWDEASSPDRYRFMHWFADALFAHGDKEQKELSSEMHDKLTGMTVQSCRSLWLTGSPRLRTEEQPDWR